MEEVALDPISIYVLYLFDMCLCPSRTFYSIFLTPTVRLISSQSVREMDSRDVINYLFQQRSHFRRTTH